MRYPQELIDRVRKLRSQGKTYGEIQKTLNLRIPKSSLSWQCKDVSLPKGYRERIDDLNLQGLSKGRRIASEMIRIKHDEFFKKIRKKNLPISRKIQHIPTAKIALAMLCLGEASKYNPITRRAFSLGNTDPRIILLFLGLLRQCFPFNIEKVRATVQCRADQDPVALKDYWQKTTSIPTRLFYKPLIDPRTKGKPTKKPGYHGVLRVDYFDTKVQLELESLADLVYNQVHSTGPVVYR
jgi:hypothetical protein